jgi:hypothetical protein
MMAAMHYLPSLRLNFSGGAFNEYRLRGNDVEFRGCEGSWRILDQEDVQLHFILRTEVAKWLTRVSASPGSGYLT